MSSFTSHIAISRFHTSHIALCKPSGLPDEKQAWTVGMTSAGDVSEVRFVDFDNATYDGTELLFAQSGHGFLSLGIPLTVDKDFNMYYISTENGRLIRYNYDTLDLEYQVVIGTNCASITYVRHLNQLAILYDTGTDGAIEFRNPVDGALINTIADIPLFDDANLRYSFATKKLYVAVNETGSEQIMIVEVDPISELVTLHSSLIPVEPISSNPAEGSYNIDSKGNHYFCYFPDFGNCTVLKLDKNFNVVWEHQNAVGGSVNAVRKIGIGPDGTVYLSHLTNTPDSRIRQIIVDENGLNPINGWLTVISDSGSDNNNISNIQVERAPSGRIFASVEGAGGLHMLSKDGTHQGIVNGGKISGFVLLPGDPGGLPE